MFFLPYCSLERTQPVLLLLLDTETCHVMSYRCEMTNEQHEKTTRAFMPVVAVFTFSSLTEFKFLQLEMESGGDSTS